MKSMQTKLINKPLTKFRNPNKKSQPTTSPLSQIGFVLPNGRIKVLSLDSGIILGRGTNTIDGATKIDLDTVAGLDNGISRNHTFIQLVNDMIMVQDYNSLNGTFLNDTELYPMRNYVVQDGDTLALGKVKIQIKFICEDE